MDIAIVGGGLAGSLLAWRLAQRSAGVVHLLTGTGADADATRASGGLVRAYEPDPQLRADAIDSLAELRAEPALAAAAGYRELGSLYVRCAGGAHLEADIAAIGRRMPEPPRCLTVRELSRLHGLTGLPDDAVGVFERTAGHLSPDRLRVTVQRALIDRGGEMVPGQVERLELGRDGGPACLMGAVTRRYDRVVVAAGAWTAALLRRSGLPVGGLTTKLVQYGLYRVAGRCPPPFVDESSGLYGRPDAPDTMLLGVPSEHWDVEPGSTRPCARCERAARRAAAARLGDIRLVRRLQVVAAVDAYSPDGRLALRRVAGADPHIHTFTGGSGGAAKTALAASTRAADCLLADAAARPRPSAERGQS